MFCYPYGVERSDGPEAFSRSSKIDEFLAEAERASKSEVKLLLLGAGNAGKTTFLKQFKMLSSKDGCLSREEIINYTSIARWAALRLTFCSRTDLVRTVRPSSDPPLATTICIPSSVSQEKSAAGTEKPLQRR